MRILRLSLDILLILAVIGFGVSVAYWFRGSLEMFPAEDQQAKAGSSAVFFCIAFAVMAVLLCAARKRTGRKRNGKPTRLF